MLMSYFQFNYFSYRIVKKIQRMGQILPIGCMSKNKKLSASGELRPLPRGSAPGCLGALPLDPAWGSAHHTPVI